MFVHGTMSNGTSWATLAAGLDGLRCILLDRPGCGLSDPFDTPVDADGLHPLAETLLVDVDACHDVMVSEHATLAAVLSQGSAVTAACPRLTPRPTLAARPTEETYR